MPGNFDNIIREVLNSTQPTQVGDVVPFSGSRPSVDTLPTPGEMYLPLWSNDGWPGSQFAPRDDIQRLNSIIKMPANDANLGSSIVRG